MKTNININDFKIHNKDVGSSEYQIANFTKKINYLTNHFNKHKKDNHSRRGLLILVNKRKNLLKYLNKTNIKRYKQLIATLKLRK